jgi:hypothetical protein
MHGIETIQVLNRVPSKYSVLLVYPDYMSDDYPETFLAHVEAQSVDEAIEKARFQLLEDDAVDELDLFDILDLGVMLVCVGHIKDLKGLVD